MDDILYLEDGKVKISDTGLQIPEFKEFKRYDNSTNKTDFNNALTYIFYVYKVFGNTKNMSPLSNMPLSQRQVYATKTYTKGVDVAYFESNKYCKRCIEAYQNYARTQAERMLDTFKQDVDDFIKIVQSIPSMITKTVTIKVKVPGEDRYEDVAVDIEIPNIEERMKKLKQAQEYKELFHKWEKEAKRDGIKKSLQAKLYEKEESLKSIDLEGFSISEK